MAGANVVGSWGLGGVAANMNLCVGLFSLNGELNFAVSSDTWDDYRCELMTAVLGSQRGESADGRRTGRGYSCGRSL